MSDGKEVKRWSLSQLDSLSSNSWTNATFVSSVEHDRIVAELKTEVARQAKVISDVKSFLDNHATRPNEVLIQIREAIEQVEGT